VSGTPSDVDLRLMAAAIRYSERHVGLTATNPSVATLLVQGGRIVGRGVTARGGRPHAERVAVDEAGEAARGATAYVTLEPCAHHGRTPPCADGLVAAGVVRVVSAAADPDPRVDGKGHAILRSGGLEVVPRVMAAEAGEPLSGYLTRHARKRPEVILKIALSHDGMIGVAGRGQVAITGAIANRQTHLLRSRVDAIMVGAGTLREDDPALTCRLPGLESRSPLRIVLDPDLCVSPEAQIVATAGKAARTLFVHAPDAPEAKRRALLAAGCELQPAERDPEGTGLALPEILEDLAATGLSSILVEGGSRIARSFLDNDLVDRLILVSSPVEIGAGGVAAAITPAGAASQFAPSRHYLFGADRWAEHVRRSA
jgi:diaminohydroxyphosphoribosylaminopyrimidine deaminase / 5-amino-6-(5-phosphoribosylamino)uracil reductase